MASFLDEGPVRLIARLGRVEAINNDNLINVSANRVGFEFDAIDADLSEDEALATIENDLDHSRLALLKILTTSAEFSRLADIQEPADGQWFAITLLPRGKLPGPYAWAASLDIGGYVESVPLVLKDIRFLFSDGDRPLRPAGAAVATDIGLAQTIAEACKFPASAIGRVSATKRVLAKLPKPATLMVNDVGQASFVTAFDGHGNPLFHLDAGWPISFNLKTAPVKPNLGSHGLPIILSHWDWDHLHGYHAIPGLSSGVWITPVQRLGPGAAKVAKKLASQHRLFGVSSGNVAAGPVVLGRSKGPKGDLNRTGLCARVILASGKVLLFVGDADYDLARPHRAPLPDFLVATHHGAKFRGKVVSPASGKGSCVVSVGKGNGYGHPSLKHVGKHKKEGWQMSFTCKWGPHARGSRLLGP